MHEPSSVSAAFIAEAKRAGTKWRDSVALESSIHRLLGEARGHFRQIDLATDDFVRGIAQRAVRGGAKTAEEAVDGFDARGVFLAIACENGVPRAIETFDQQVLKAKVPGFLARLNQSPSFSDEIVQQLRLKLFVPQNGKPARITAYDGRAKIESWLRVVAVRAALNEMRPRGAHETPLPEGEIPIPVDMELQVLHRQYAAEVNGALKASLLLLPAKDRNLLRFYYLKGIKLEPLGVLLGVDHSSVSRRLARIKKSIHSQTKQRLKERLQIASSTFNQLMAEVQSALDPSLSQVLRHTAPEEVSE